MGAHVIGIFAREQLTYLRNCCDEISLVVKEEKNRTVWVFRFSFHNTPADVAHKTGGRNRRNAEDMVWHSKTKSPAVSRRGGQNHPDWLTDWSFGWDAQVDLTTAEWDFRIGGVSCYRMQKTRKSRRLCLSAQSDSLMIRLLSILASDEWIELVDHQEKENTPIDCSHFIEFEQSEKMIASNEVYKANQHKKLHLDKNEDKKEKAVAFLQQATSNQKCFKFVDEEEGEDMLSTVFERWKWASRKKNGHDCFDKYL